MRTLSNLFQLPIGELIDACSTDRTAREICGQDDFWIRKFKNDGLTLINKRTNFANWILEYQYLVFLKKLR